MSGRSSHGGAKEPTQRQLRVGEEIRHTIIRVIERGEVRDPDVADATITVTEVRVSPDLKNATAFVIPLGGSNADTAVAGLNRARAFIRHQIARSLTLRYTPDIRFEFDRSFDEAGRIDALLKGVLDDAAGQDQGGND